MNCRFCNAEEKAQSIKGEFVYGGTAAQHFWECGECGIIYLYPPLSQDDEIEFYKKEFEKYMDGRAGHDKGWYSPQRHFDSNKDECNRRMLFLEFYLNEHQNVLEVGCSSGFMLSAIKEKDINVRGIDPSETFTNYIEAQNIPVYSDIESLKNKCGVAFDLIIHYYVLEHARNPVEFINQYMTMLAPSGKMIFEVPCATDPLIELYNIEAFDLFYWSVAHNWYFNYNSLTKVLEKTNYKFELFPEQRYDLSNHMVWMRDGKPGGMNFYHDVFGTDLEDLYKQRLKNKWLCDTIIAVVENYE